ncbi:metal ABC transporter substrate-binding protein [Chloroflexota bacterium]
MRNCRIFAGVVLAIGLIVGTVLSGCKYEETAGIKVVTTTSLMEQIVKRVGGDLVDVVNIIPPAQCPGHFDVSPSDIQKLADADLFLLHGWQGEMFSEELIASADNPDLTSIQINASVGENTNWMTPEVQMVAADLIADALAQVDAANSDAYEEAADEYKDEVEAKGEEIEAELADKDLGSINVLCSEQLFGFVQWTGLNIVEIYGRPDAMTPQVVMDLVDTGREENVTLIIENMQSGPEAGVGVAEELDCGRIILSNFPGGYEDAETWEEAVDYNIELILEAISQ